MLVALSLTLLNLICIANIISKHMTLIMIHFTRIKKFAKAMVVMNIEVFKTIQKMDLSVNAGMMIHIINMTQLRLSFSQIMI